MTQEIHVDVIDRKGKKKFQYRDPERGFLSFDTFLAFSEFDGGKLKLVRNNSVLTETTSIYDIGGHVGSTAFNGLTGLFNTESPNAPVTGISADELEIGDRLILETNGENLSFGELLRLSYYGPISVTRAPKEPTPS